jgi:hypothetical protein
MPARRTNATSTIKTCHQCHTVGNRAEWERLRGQRTRGDVGVLEELESNESIVVRGLGILEDAGELLQMARPEDRIKIERG